jgi:hypothetical protein
MLSSIREIKGTPKKNKKIVEVEKKGK